MQDRPDGSGAQRKRQVPGKSAVPVKAQNLNRRALVVRMSAAMPADAAAQAGRHLYPIAFPKKGTSTLRHDSGNLMAEDPRIHQSAMSRRQHLDIRRTYAAGSDLNQHAVFRT